MTWDTRTGRFEPGDIALDSGEVLRNASLSWKTFGRLAAARDNVIVFPTSYSAQHMDQEWLIGPDGILDPTRWFIVVPDMFGNGLSSSPSETRDYPALVTAADNVRMQKRLLNEAFGIETVACVYGFSMGGQQAYHWAALFPDAVARAVVVCGSARTAVHNRVFLQALQATLEAAPEHLGGGRFSAQPEAAMRAFCRIYATMALSQDWYRENLHLKVPGAASLDDFLDRVWAPGFLRRKAENLYAQASTWLASDISANPLYEGDLVRALQAIEARMLLMPSRTDLYFPVADNAGEMAHLRHAELRPIPSIWGHRAGNPSANPADAAFLRNAVRDWLSRG
jgi:homoserine O-acetyltransferase